MGADSDPSRPSADPVEFVVDRASAGARLDRFVAGCLGISRSEVQRWIDAWSGDRRRRRRAKRAPGCGRASESSSGPSRARPPSPCPTRAWRSRCSTSTTRSSSSTSPPGLVVHPARGHERGTLVNGLLARRLFRRDSIDDLGDAGDGDDAAHVRPGIVHRLDKGTSGVMVVARTARAREALKAQFQAHSIERAYEAIVVGHAQAQTIVDAARPPPARPPPLHDARARAASAP